MLPFRAIDFINLPEAPGKLRRVMTKD
jgi:hypothetical protein